METINATGWELLSLIPLWNCQSSIQRLWHSRQLIFFLSSSNKVNSQICSITRVPLCFRCKWNCHESFIHALQCFLGWFLHRLVLTGGYLSLAKPPMDKLINGQPLTVEDCLQILTKATQKEEKVIPECSNRIYDEIQRLYRDNFEANAQAALYLVWFFPSWYINALQTNALSAYNNSIDKLFYSNHLSKIIQTVDTLLSDPKGFIADPKWETVVMALMVVYSTDLVGKVKYYNEAIPCVMKALHYSRIQGTFVHGIHTSRKWLRIRHSGCIVLSKIFDWLCGWVGPCIEKVHSHCWITCRCVQGETWYVDETHSNAHSILCWIWSYGKRYLVLV